MTCILHKVFCRQKTFIKNAVSANRDTSMPGNRDLLKVVREGTQSVLCSCYHTCSKSPTRTTFTLKSLLRTSWNDLCKVFMCINIVYLK